MEDYVQEDKRSEISSSVTPALPNLPHGCKRTELDLRDRRSTGPTLGGLGLRRGVVVPSVTTRGPLEDPFPDSEGNEMEFLSRWNLYRQYITLIYSNGISF